MVTRKFGNRVFTLYDSGFTNKLKAKSAAVRLRAKGYKVRVVKYKGEWAVFRRHA